MKRKPITKAQEQERRARRMAIRYLAYVATYMFGVSETTADQIEDKLTKLLLRCMKIGKESR